MIEPMTLVAPLLVLSYTQWVAISVYRRATFVFLTILSAGFYSFGAILDEHGREAGNPFRSDFSGLVVARQVGLATTTIWLAFTLLTAGLLAWIILRKDRRVAPLGPPPTDSTDPFTSAMN